MRFMAGEVLQWRAPASIMSLLQIQDAFVDDKDLRPGRNAPCTCGSGKKYKHCCGSARATRST
jgi:uncharacterized protein YchJ